MIHQAGADIEVITRPDGAIWHRFEVDGCQATLTSRGRELFAAHPEYTERMRLYVKKALGEIMIDSTCENLRNFFAEGTNSRVYTFAEGVVVKETNGHSMERALDRMDRTCTAMELHTPAWLNLAVHYGMLQGPDLPHQYVMMEQIDSGVNVGHITSPNDYSLLERRGVHEAFGTITNDERDQIEKLYNEAEGLIHQALADEGLVPPTDYLTDWHPENVVVERLTTPVAGVPFGLWVIDQ